MAKKDKIEFDSPTLQDYLIMQLDKPVAIKGGGTLKDPTDGHELTATEAIAMKIMQNALSGDLKSADYIIRLESVRRARKNKV